MEVTTTACLINALTPQTTTPGFNPEYLRRFSMTRVAMTIITTALVVILAAPAAADDHVGSGETAFDIIVARYEAIHGALASDTIDGITENALAIQTAAEAAAEDFSAQKAGVATAKADACRKLLPEVAGAAAKLAAAKNESTAREAFAELSRPMIRWREMVTGERPKVAYCPMAKKPWLQDSEEIANPYYGSKMLRCGEIVSK
jgi:hypothetical protein